MINEEQLQTWAKAPSETEMGKIRHTREMVEESLQQHLPISEIKRQFNLSTFKYSVYLQGSYSNSTNIRYDSDVDIVVQLNSVFSYDDTQLTSGEKDLHSLVYPNTSAYTFSNFKKHVRDALVAGFGENEVEYGKKCLKVKANTNRVDADVIPCFKHKLYKRFISHANQDYVPGIKFYNTDNNSLIINYPKVHLKNCESKNTDTGEKFKDVVRIFKNIKSKLVEENKLTTKEAPSYFIENILYNCSSQCFDGNYTENMTKTLQFLFDAINTGRLSGFICANEQDSLISEKTWNILDAQKTILSVAGYFLES